MSWSDSKLDNLLAILEQPDLTLADRTATFQAADARLARLARRYDRAVVALERMNALADPANQKGAEDDDDESDDDSIRPDDLPDQIQECLEQIRNQAPISQIISQVEQISLGVQKHSASEGTLEMATASLKLKRLDLNNLLDP